MLVCTHIHTRPSNHTDSFCAFSVQHFQQAAVIRGRQTVRVSEDSQHAWRQQGAIWKPRPHVEPLLWYCLPAEDTGGCLMNTAPLPAVWKWVCPSIVSWWPCALREDCWQRGRSQNEGSSHYRLRLFSRSSDNKSVQRGRQRAQPSDDITCQYIADSS